MTLAANAQLDHYEILAPLGKGGMGEVYRARDMRLNRAVALKVLPESFAQDADRLHRFEQEARATSALNHPNILTVHDFGLHAGAPYLVMELLEGEELRAQLQQGALPIATALDYAEQIAAGLAIAHEKGIVHRDLKPENLFITNDGRVKILDFGLAKLKPQRAEPVGSEVATQKQITSPGTVMGTASYMSPEQARGEKVDARSDLFSLGVVLYEMLAGQRPFVGANMLDIVGAVLHQEPKPLVEAPPEVQRIVSKALQKDRERRYQTSKDLLLDLQTLKHELAIEARLQGRAAANEVAQTVSLRPVTTDERPENQTASSTKIILTELKRHKLGIALTLVLLLAAIGSYFTFFANNKPIDSLAILPFTNASGDPEMEYLSDGLTESLINNLAQLPRLRVLPRTMVFRFKGKTDDPQRIGKELGVRAVLTGRVQQRGDSLVIQTELIEVTGAAQLWGDRYDRKPSDLLATQREVTQAIAGGLRLKLSGAEQQQLAKRGTENNEAYQLYLKGQFYRRSGGGTADQALDYFKQAVALDPNFALAWVGIADVYAWLESSSVIDPKEAHPQKKAALAKALALDDNLADAHGSLGYLKAIEWDWDGAEREYSRAIELAPNLAKVHSDYADYLSNIGRHNEALNAVRRAQEINRLDIIYRAQEGVLLHNARRNEEAIEKLRSVLALEPNHHNTLWYLGSTYAAKGMLAEAIVEYQKASRIDSQDTNTTCMMIYLLAQTGKPAEARALLRQLQASGKYVSPGVLAISYLGLGDKEAALAWLQKAYDAHDPQMVGLKTWHYDSVRSEARFQDLLRRMGLPQ